MGDGRMHAKTIRAALAAMVLVAVAASPLFGQEEPAAPYTGNAGRLAVLPYFAPPGSLPPEYAFSVFTVTDVIRLTLLEQDRFALVEKSEIDAAANALGLPDNWPEEELLCIQLSREASADYLIRGYVAWMGDALKVFHILIDTASGRTLHMSERGFFPLCESRPARQTTGEGHRGNGEDSGAGTRSPRDKSVLDGSWPCRFAPAPADERVP